MSDPRPYVAVVDDEESVRRALVRLLRASAFDVEAFASGQSFLEALPARRPDCLVLDIQMAGLTGRDLQRHLAVCEVRIPVIIMTAYDEPMMREQCLADGAYAYFRKPLRGDALMASINAAITHGPRNSPLQNAARP